MCITQITFLHFDVHYQDVKKNSTFYGGREHATTNFGVSHFNSRKLTCILRTERGQINETYDLAFYFGKRGQIASQIPDRWLE